MALQLPQLEAGLTGGFGAGLGRAFQTGPPAARHWLLRKAREHHQYKLTAALLEEMQAASPEVAGRMFAASLGYLCKPGDRDHPLWALVGGR